MKRFGKVFLTRFFIQSILPRLVFVVIVTVGFTYLFTYIYDQDKATLLANQKQVSEQQASVDNYTVAIKAAISKDQNILSIYNSTDPQDVEVKNLITYDLIQHQSACQSMITQYNKVITTLPNYIKTETFKTGDCLGH